MKTSDWFLAAIWAICAVLFVLMPVEGPPAGAFGRPCVEVSR